MENPYPAFHALWTKPVTITGAKFGMNGAEMLTMAVSALMWQKYNGPIKLFTDKCGYGFVQENGLEGLWNGGIDAVTLESNGYPIDPHVFWAAGKLIALEATTAPCVMLDYDLVVTAPIGDVLAGSSVAALHPEALDPEVYLPARLLKIPSGYAFPADFNWNVLPSNTALLYVGDGELKSDYIRESKNFMFHNTSRPAELVSQMVFAEQRLISICADRAGHEVRHLLDNPFSMSNRKFIHLWGFKKLLRENVSLREFYSKQLLKALAGELEPYPLFRKKFEGMLERL
ncbi:MAG TPA: DUF6734 family protein [Paludibacter sp.]|nr:DUF6734 family protein [Paludibacter sp.]